MKTLLRVQAALLAVGVAVVCASRGGVIGAAVLAAAWIASLGWAEAAAPPRSRWWAGRTMRVLLPLALLYGLFFFVVVALPEPVELAERLLEWLFWKTGLGFKPAGVWPAAPVRLLVRFVGYIGAVGFVTTALLWTSRWMVRRR